MKALYFKFFIKDSFWDFLANKEGDFLRQNKISDLILELVGAYLRSQVILDRFWLSPVDDVDCFLFTTNEMKK